MNGEFTWIQTKHVRQNGLGKPLTHLIRAGGQIQAIDNRDEEVPSKEYLKHRRTPLNDIYQF